jgi:hypothetical protein
MSYDIHVDAIPRSIIESSNEIQLVCDIKTITSDPDDLEYIEATTCVFGYERNTDYNVCYTTVVIDGVIKKAGRNEVCLEDCYYYQERELFEDGGSGGNLHDERVTIYKTNETAQFFTETTTYDMRKQSIINRLMATLEEGRVRREAARANKEET